MDIATIKSMVNYYLMQTKLDGLCHPDYECSCVIGELMPCDEPDPDCFGGYKLPCNCNEGCDFHIGIE